jgi:hypothetical protein
MPEELEECLQNKIKQKPPPTTKMKLLEKDTTNT